MTSRLAQWSDRLLQAGTLLCVPAGSIYFSTHSARGFEPDKIILLRSFILIMTAAWLIWQLETAEIAALKRWRPPPITLALLGLAGAGVISVICSLEPLLSWQGSYLRSEGLSALLLYLALFGFLVTTIRGRREAERLITCIIMPLPCVCAFATLQRLGLDPLWGDVTITRVGSTAGNAVALGAYLITCAPLLAYRLVELLRRGASRLNVALHAGLVLWVGIIMLWTAARGPTVGLGVALMLAGWVSMRRAPRPALTLVDAAKSLGFVSGALAACFLLAWGGAWLLGARRLEFSFYASLAAVAAVAGALGLAAAAGRSPRWARLAVIWLIGFVLLGASVLNVPPEQAARSLPSPVVSTLEAWRTLPWVWRFSRLLDPGKSTGRVRALLWDGALRQLRDGVAVIYPGGATDRLRSLRWLVGWGPETQALTYPQFYPPELATLERADQRVDRVHNQTFDLLLTQGALGLLAWHAAFLAGLLGCLATLGFEMGWVAVAAWFAGGLASAGAVTALGAPIWLGLVFPVGALLGFASCVPSTARPVEPWKGNLSLACLVVLTGHLVEMQVGFPLVPSTLNLFCALALIRLLPNLTEDDGSVPEPAWEMPVLTLLLMIVCAALLSPIAYLTKATSAAQVPSVPLLLREFLWGSNQTRTFDNPGGALWLALSWVGGLALVWGNRARAGLGATVGRSLLPLLAAFLATAALAHFLRPAYFWLHLSSESLTPDGAAGLAARGFQALLAVVGLGWAACWLWLTWQLRSPSRAAVGYRHPAALPVTFLLGGLSLLLVWTWCFRAAVADVLYAQVQNVQLKQAEAAGAAEGWMLPVATLEIVVKLAPRVDMYVSFLGDYLGRQASQSQAPPDQEYLRSQARLRMVRARDLAPLEVNNATNVALASVELARLLPPGDPRREQLGAEARSEYERALKMSPFHADLKVEIGNRMVEEFGDLDRAEQLFREAVRVEPRCFGAFYGLASVLERRARAWPEGSAERQRLLRGAAAAALAGTRCEPPGPGRDQRHEIMLKLHEAAGMQAPPGR